MNCNDLLSDWTPVDEIFWYVAPSGGHCPRIYYYCSPLQWRHNGRDDVSNHQPHHCLLNRLFRRRSKKTLKLRVTDLCAVTDEFPAQMASNAKIVSIWWRHHALVALKLRQFPSRFGNRRRTLLAPGFRWYAVLNEWQNIYLILSITATRGYFYSIGLTLIQAWISNYKSWKCGTKFTHPFPNYNGCPAAKKTMKYNVSQEIFPRFGVGRVLLWFGVCRTHNIHDCITGTEAAIVPVPGK